MRPKSLAIALVLLAALAYAKDQKSYQGAKLLQMDSVSCGADTKNSKSHDLLCQEYTLEADQVDYSIRPADDKHRILLPVGADAQFRLEKVTLLLRVPSLDNKERKFAVVAVKPRTEKSPEVKPVKLNHLQ